MNQQFIIKELTTCYKRTNSMLLMNQQFVIKELTKCYQRTNKWL